MADGATGCACGPKGRDLIGVKGGEIPCAALGAIVAEGLPGDIGMQLARSTVYRGWAVWSTAVAAAALAQDAAVVNMANATGLESVDLRQMGLTTTTGSTNQIAGLINKARVVIGDGTYSPTPSELETWCRNLYLRVSSGGNLDYRHSLYTNVESWYKEVDLIIAASQAAGGIGVRELVTEDLPDPVLMQWAVDSAALGVFTRSAITPAAITRVSVLVHGVFWKTGSQDLRQGCLPEDQYAVARAMTVPRLPVAPRANLWFTNTRSPVRNLNGPQGGYGS